MSKLKILIFIFLPAFTFHVRAQITVTRTEKLPLPRSQVWSHPQFSPNGSSIYFTDEDGNGIWGYSLQSRSFRQVTADPKSGFAYSLSADGKNLIYRRTTYENSGRSRKQDIVLINLAQRSSSVVASGTDVSIPTFSNNVAVYTLRSKTIGLAKTAGVADISVLGIEETKIVLSVNGKKTLLDPLGNGSYIWPVLSPDKRQLVAYEMDKGSFVCDLRGKVISRLGRRDSPSWTRSGRWIISMKDKDDGHRILSSDIFAITPDGKTVVQLTTTEGVLEMYPQCSPTQNKIVCDTPEGAIILLEYAERQ